MSALRKGWCPGALRPMAAADGYLVRLRLTAGRLPASMASRLAALSTQHGNGLFDLSARANLQMRGVSDASLPDLQDALHDMGLLDPSPEAEAIRNVMVNPWSGLDGADLLPVVADVEQMLVQTPQLHDLPGKFGFLIDDGTPPGLAEFAADIRFEAGADRDDFTIGLAGDRATAIVIGTCPRAHVPQRAVALALRARTVLAQHPDCRRLVTLRRRLGAGALADAFGARAEKSLPPSMPPAFAELVGTLTVGSEPVAGFAAPFGRLTASNLHALAQRAAAGKRQEIRLSPWRILYVPGAAPREIEGLITDPTDPRLRIAACPGAPGCARGSRPTHADAAHMAPLLPQNLPGIVLHVSGCEKGCAKPTRSALTLIARDGTYGVVRDGRAGDPSLRDGLDLEAAMRLVEAHAW